MPKVLPSKQEPFYPPYHRMHSPLRKRPHATDIRGILNFRPSLPQEELNKTSTEFLQCKLLREDLKSRKNIVVVSGAGISTEAGVNDFRSYSKSKNSSLNTFDVSAFCTEESAEKLHNTIYEIYKSASNPKLSRLELAMDELAQDGRLLSHFTQNFDCRPCRLTSLAERTVWMHGRADTMMCHIRSEHTIRVSSDSCQKWALTPCPECQAEMQKRVDQGKRPRDIGVLRSKVLLYGEHSPDEEELGERLESDLEQPVDAVIIIGTRLRIEALRSFVQRIHRKAKQEKRDIVTIWVSNEAPVLGKGFQSLIDYQWLGDCNDFASCILA